MTTQTLTNPSQMLPNQSQILPDLYKTFPNITQPIQNSSSANPLGGAQNSTQIYVAFLVGLQLKLSSTSAYIQGNFN